MDVSRLVNSYSQEIKLSFTAEKYFAIKGEEISIFWESTNANSNVLTPGNLMLETQGEERITIGERATKVGSFGVRRFGWADDECRARQHLEQHRNIAKIRRELQEIFKFYLYNLHLYLYIILFVLFF